MHALLFVGIGSVMLVSLYFFFAYIETALTVCVLISAFSASSIFIGDFLTQRFKNSFLNIEY